MRPPEAIRKQLRAENDHAQRKNNTPISLLTSIGTVWMDAIFDAHRMIQTEYEYIQVKSVFKGLATDGHIGAFTPRAKLHGTPLSFYNYN
jgi:hypothetical protein